MADDNLPELWLPVTGWPYEVSNQGRVRPTKWSRSNPNRRPLKPEIDRYGYTCYTLMHEGKKWHCKVHQLICAAWHGPAPFEGAQVRHLDDVKSNNEPSNLAWGTPTDQISDRYRLGSIKYGDENHRTVHNNDLVNQLKAEHTIALQGRYTRVPHGWIDFMAQKYGLTRNQVITIVYHERRQPPVLNSPKSKKGARRRPS